MSLYKGSTLIAGGRQSMPLLSFMWADHQLNDMSWLRADTFSWQSDSVYKATYQHLVKDICAQYWGTNPDGTGLVVFTKALEEISIGSSVYDTDLTTVLGTITAIDTVNNTITVSSDNPSINTTFYNGGLHPTTLTQSIWETINGITIRSFIASDGHKICLADEETDIDAVYNATGVAWYYILDTTNQRFKLPRINPDLEELTYQISAFGDGDYLRFMSSDGSNKGSYINSRTENLGNKTGWLRTYNSGGSLVNLDNMKLSDVKGQSGIKVEKDTIFSGKKYLYFYVGNFTQTALENTAGLNAEMFNDLNTHKVIEFQEPTTQNNYTWYRKYADGWVEQGGSVFISAGTGGWMTFINLPVAMADSNFTAIATMLDSTSNFNCPGCMVRAQTTTTITISIATSRNNQGSARCSWEVKGMAASTS